MIPGISIIHSQMSDGNFSYAWGEINEVRSNREIFLHKLGLKLEDCVALNLKHTKNVAVVTKEDRGKGMDSLESGYTADAMVTTDPQVVLFLLTADCLPVVMYDPIRRAVAVAHVSRINTDLQFLPEIIGQMKKLYSSDPAVVRVYIGPCIHAPHEHFHRDLIQENRDQLVQAGIHNVNIETNPLETYGSKDYFSHRRSVDTGEPEGRFATVVRL